MVDLPAGNFRRDRDLSVGWLGRHTVSLAAIRVAPGNPLVRNRTSLIVRLKFGSRETIRSSPVAH